MSPYRVVVQGAAALSPTSGTRALETCSEFTYLRIMKTSYPEYWPQFYTATIYKWQHLLADDKHKDTIVDSLKYLVNDKRIELNAFVIMSNHIHLIWQPMFGFTPSDIQSSFMKFTAQQLKQSLTKNNTGTLSKHKVNKYDREYQFWKRESLAIELISPAVFE